MAFYETLPVYCDAIFHSYRPYNKLLAFWEGLEAEGYDNPYDGLPAFGREAQAWDRGREARMRCQRAMVESHP